MIRRREKSPYLQIIDKQTKKRFSLKPIEAWENLSEILRVHELILHIGNNPWPEMSIGQLLEVLENPDASIYDCKYDWNKIQLLTLQHCLNKNKGVDVNVKSDLTNLVKNNLPFKWQAIKSWVYEKNLEERPFRNRIDSLTQIRLALTNQYGDEPDWLKKSEIMNLRELHKLAYKKATQFISNESQVRGIPTKEQLEEYLHSLDKKFKLEKFCIACQLNYGLRNHEFFHSSIIKESNTEEGLYQGHLYVPGEWRTKSFEHFVWPLYESWVKEFNLIEDFQEMQEELHSRVKINIVSAFDKTKKWVDGDPSDRGVCINNRYLGNWLTKRMKNYLPPLMGNVPDAEGLPDKEIKPQRITPYDLRHTWAIRHATDSRCNGITDEMAAKAMGHSVEIHRKNYQKWVSKVEARRQYMSVIPFPKE
tara:strand:- start:1260 stop:2519 length:1260 start_codon:yes stop_codon:yes gene_type:complete